MYRVVIHSIASRQAAEKLAFDYVDDLLVAGETITIEPDDVETAEDELAVSLRKDTPEATR